MVNNKSCCPLASVVELAEATNDLVRSSGSCEADSFYKCLCWLAIAYSCTSSKSSGCSSCFKMLNLQENSVLMHTMMGLSKAV